MFGEIRTPEQAKAFSDYIKASIDFHRKVTPKYLRINKTYLNKFINSEKVTQFEINHDGDINVDYEGIIPFSGIPVVIDNTIETYEFVYDNEN